MVHPGYPNGAATGLLVKDYRGKDANQEVWKFDSALEARLADDLKQAAIEEGQWSDKREVQAAGAAERKAGINRGRIRPMSSSLNSRSTDRRLTHGVKGLGSRA